MKNKEKPEKFLKFKCCCNMLPKNIITLMTNLKKSLKNLIEINAAIYSQRI